jgi:hypothetical protein
VKRLLPGLVSVTFRQHGVEEVMRLVQEAGLSGIEWGGDVHVPHGDVHIARDVARRMVDGGLTTPCYGSYYRLGHAADDDVPDFEAVVETAQILSAPTVRVWAGRRNPDEADSSYLSRVYEDAQRVADLAKSVDIQIAVEWHGNTLTHTAQGARDLAMAVPELLFDWQPSRHRDVEQRRHELRSIGRLAHMHVFHWKEGHDGQAIRRPLAEASDAWPIYLMDAALKPMSSVIGDTFALIEFVRDNDPVQFREDAKVLKQWVENVNETFIAGT